MIFIDVKIPWEPGKKLGYAINRAMKTVRDWVLILDHDVFLSLNPHWYEICQNAISQVGHQAGWITCVTNQIGCPLQKADYSIQKYTYNFSKEYDTNDMNKHFELAEIVYQKNKGKVEDITEATRRWKLSGLFILTHKKAYEDVLNKFGLPDNKFIGWDNYYNDRLFELGYTMHLMQDLYIYHGYKRLWKNEGWGKGIVGHE